MDAVPDLREPPAASREADRPPRTLAEIMAEGQPPPRLLEGEGIELAAPRRVDLSYVPRGAGEPPPPSVTTAESSGPEMGTWFSRPTPLEVAMQGAFLGLAATDWQQTRAFRKLGVEEMNPLLGRRPSVGKVDTMVPAAMAAHTLAAYALPRPWRNIAQVLGLGAETWAVAHNARDLKGAHRVGLGWKF